MTTFSSKPFISASELADELHEPNPPAVLDASIQLHPAKFDGDYRKDILRDEWVAAHIPGSQYVNVAAQFSDEQPGCRAIDRELNSRDCGVVSAAERKHIREPAVVRRALLVEHRREAVDADVTAGIERDDGCEAARRDHDCDAQSHHRHENLAFGA